VWEAFVHSGVEDGYSLRVRNRLKESGLKSVTSGDLGALWTKRTDSECFPPVAILSFR